LELVSPIGRSTFRDKDLLRLSLELCRENHNETYPSIKKSFRDKNLEKVHVFDKLDGSNLRFQWHPNKGWFRWGSRRRLLTEEHPIFGQALSLFQERLAESLEKIAVEEQWKEGLVAFAEFHGEQSFAGRHQSGDPKRLTLFDVAPHKRGLLGPERFLELFGELDTPRYLGHKVWNADFVEAVRQNQVKGVTLEGVIGKTGEGHKLVMAKAKTQRWVDQVLERFDKEEALKLIHS
jgi:hypothetical protein